MLQKNPEYPRGSIRQEDQKLPNEIRNMFYRIEKSDHTCFYGEIVVSYVIEL